MSVEQKTRLMCSWVKGTHSQAFRVEVEGNSCLEGETVEHSGTEKSKSAGSTLLSHSSNAQNETSYK